MAIDLNGSATGLNYATTYQEEDPAASIVSSTATVGSSSNSANTDQITVIRVELASVLFHDRWHINALPASIAIATTETGSASYLTPPMTLSAQGNQVLYLRPSGNGSVTDVAWQNALKAIGFQTNETQGGSRTVNVSAKGASGTWSTPASTEITVQAVNDEATDIELGRRFDGTTNSVIVGGPLMAADTDFSFELKISPTNTITLHNPGPTAALGRFGQAYAVAPEHGYYSWGSTDHAGVGLSVGTNGISVYVWTLNFLEPLLTWAGTVNPNTHVAVVFNNKTPTLYVDGVAVMTGVQSNKIIHPTARLGGTSWGHFTGVIGDYYVWNDALTATQVQERANATELAAGASPAVAMLASPVLVENAAAGTLVARVGALDQDTGEAFTYQLLNNANGRFVIDQTTGEIRVATGAQIDHEATPTLQVEVRATDAGGHITDRIFNFNVRDVNEAPQLANDHADASIGQLALAVDQSHRLWWVDLSSGQRSQAATASAPITAIARTGDGLYYAVSADTLYRLNPATGSCTAVGTTGGLGNVALVGLSAADNGKLYGVNTVGNLYEINPQTGTGHQIVAVNSSVSSHGDVAYLNGAVYWNTVWGDLLRYDIATGQHQTVLSGLPTPGGLSHISSLTVSGPHELLAIDDTTALIHRINLQTGTFTTADIRLPQHTADQTLVDATAVHASGNVFANDPARDAGDTHQVVEDMIVGDYGYLTLNADGTYSYSVFPEYSELLQQPGETLEDRFTYTVVDGIGQTSTAELVVTVRGHTDAPTVPSWQVTAVEAGGVHNGTAGVNPSGNVLDGAVGPSDDTEHLQVTRLVHNGSPLALGARVALTYGHLTLSATGEYLYEVNQTHQAVEALRTAQNTLTETVSFDVAGLLGTTRTASLSFTIEGRDDAPVAHTAGATAWASSGVDHGTAGQNPSGQLNFAAADVDDPAANIGVSWVNTRVNVVRNGSFEDVWGHTQPGSWLTSGLPGTWANPADQVNFVRDNSASDGQVYVDLDSWSAVDSLQQTALVTQAGKAYQLKFDLAPVPGYSGSAVQVYWNNVLVGTATVNPAGWSTATFNVIAVGNDTLRFAELATENDTAGPKIDNVRLYLGGVDQTLRGQYGTLTINEDGTYHYAVDQANLQVQALRRPQDTLQDTFDYTITDAAGLTSSSTFSVTIEGRNDAPAPLVIGRQFNGNAASVVSGPALGSSSNFSFELTVTPVEAILLKGTSLTGAAGSSGQKYALSPLQGETVWGSASHAGLGISVGTNGISVYQHTAYVLSSLLTWSGTVTANTHVAVNVIDNRPSLYINNQLVATGLQSTKLLHPPTEVGGISYGYFTGSVADVRVWNEPFLWQAGGSPDMHPQYESLALSVAENAAAGTVLTSLRSTDVDTGDTLTYSLVDNGGGLFQINATTGAVSLAPGATPDHETNPVVTLRARVTDIGGLYRELTFNVRVTDVNEAPTSTGGEATMNEDNQVRLDLTRVEDLVIEGQNVPAVRIDSLPQGGQLTLDGQPVSIGQTLAASDALRMVFRPALFSTAAFHMNDVDAGDHLSAVRITALPSPAQGRLTLNGVEVGQENNVILAQDFEHLTFEPALHFNGHATFQYRVIDGHGIQQGGEASTFTIHVNPVNDAPVIAPTLTIEVQEGSSTRLKGLQVSDVDAGNAEISVTLKVESGLLNASSTANVTVEGSGSTELVLRGTVSALNAMLGSEPGVSYQAEANLYPTQDVQMQFQTVLNDNPSDPIIRVAYSTASGVLDAAAATGITITGNGTPALSVEGRSSLLSQYLIGENVTRAMPITTQLMNVIVNDGGSAGIDPGLTANNTSEQDTRTIALNVVPLGLSLLDPEQLDPSMGNAAGSGAPGTGSAAALAGTPVNAPLVLALGHVDRITSAATANADEQSAAMQMWNELHENLHPNGANARHEWRELVYWLPPAGPIAADGTYDVAEPGEQASNVQSSLIQIPGLFEFASKVLFALTLSDPSFRELYPPTVADTGPEVFALAPSIDLNEDQPVQITEFSFWNSIRTGRDPVWVRFELREGDGVLSVDTNGHPKVAVANNDSSSLVLIGLVSDIKHLISDLGLTFSPDPDVSGARHLDVTIGRGVLPNSGDTGLDNASVDLHIAPVPEAPMGEDATFDVEHASSFVLMESRFGFSDEDGNSFAGVQITELPDSGQLLLNGVPVEQGQVIGVADLSSYRLAYVADTTLIGEAVHPRIGFQVIDSGSANNFGAVKHLFFNVEYPTVLVASQTSVAFNEADRQALHWLSGVELSNRSSTAPGFKTIRITANDMTDGDRWTIDPAWLGSLQAPLPFERVDALNGVSEIRFEPDASLDLVKAVLGALVFETQSPNTAEGTRSFSVQVIDVDDQETPPEVVDLTVTSILGELTRALETADAALQARADAGPLPPTAATAAADAHAAWTLHDTRAALAQAVAQALAEAVPTAHGGLLMGTSLEPALRALGMGDGASLLLDATEPDDDLLSKDWFNTLIRDPDTNTLWLPAEQRTALLTWAEDQRSRSLQSATMQFMAAIESPQTVVDSADPDAKAWKLPAGVWLVDTLARSIGNGVAPQVIESAAPWAVWATQPHAWVKDVAGDLYLNDSAWRQLVTSARVQLIDLQDDSGSAELLALQALQAAKAVDNHWLVDARVLAWLASADITVPLLSDAGDGAQPWLDQPGVVVQSAEGLRMAPPTLLDLQQRLMQQLDDAGNDATSEQRLFAALTAILDDEGEALLPAEARAWLDSLDLGIRWVSELGTNARPGEIAQAETDGPLSLTAATRDSLYARLIAREAAESAHPGTAEAAGPVGSEMLQVKRALEQAQTSPLADTLRTIDADAVVLEWLQSSGQAVISTAGYQALGMNDALTRLLARPDVVVFEPTTHTLHLGETAFQRLGTVAGAVLEHSFQTDPATTGPLAPQPPTVSVNSQHEAALQSGASGLDASELLQAWADSLEGLRALIGPTTSALPDVDQAETLGVRLLDESLAEDVVQVLAQAGIAVNDLGAWDALTPTQRAALSDAGHPALARDAFGEPFMNEAVLEALQSRLLAQAFGERAELARTAIGRLAAAPEESTGYILFSPGDVVAHLYQPNPAPTSGEPTYPVLRLSTADLAMLQQLGIDPAPIEVVDGYMPLDLVQGLEQGTVPVVVDHRSGAVWVGEATHGAWLAALAGTMQASHIARYEADPAAITDPEHTGDPVGMAYAVQLTGTDAEAWTSEVVATGVVRISLGIDTLLAAHLAMRTFNGDSDDLATLAALRVSQTGTVMTDAAEPGSVFMSANTWAALLAQSDRILQSNHGGASEIGPKLLDAIEALTVVEHAFSASSTALVWMPANDALLPALQAAQAPLTLWSDGGSAEPPTELPVNTYAVFNGRVIVSQDTLALWRDTLTSQANSLGSPQYGQPSWLDAPAVVYSQDTLTSASASQASLVATQLTALLVDARRDSESAGDGTVLWHIPPLDGRLSADFMSFLLAERSVPGFETLTLSGTDASALAELINAEGPAIGIAPDGSVCLSEFNHQLAIAFLHTEEQKELDHHGDRLSKQLIGAIAQGDWVQLPLGVTLNDLQTALPNTDLNRTSGSQPEVGEIGIDHRGQLWLHNATRLKVLNEIGAGATVDTPADAQSLLAHLNAATITSSPFGIYSLDAAAASLLQAFGLGTSLSGIYGGGVLGVQNLGDAGPGHFQAGADGRLYLTDETLASLRAVASGLVNAQPVSSAETLGEVVTLLNYLSELQGNTLIDQLPAPLAGHGGEMGSLAFWQHLRNWVVVDSGTLLNGLKAQVGLSGNWLATLIEHAPVKVVDLETDDALLAALQSGDLRKDFVIVRDAADNLLMSTETRGLLIEWIANDLTQSTGIDWASQYGLTPDVPGVEHASSKRALLDAQQDNSTVSTLYTDTGAVMAAVLAAQAGGANHTVRIDLDAGALQSWLASTGLRGLHRLSLTEVNDPELVEDGQFAEEGGDLIVTRYTASQLLDTGLATSNALVMDTMPALMGQFATGNYSVEGGYVVVNGSTAFDLWRNSTDTLRTARARDLSGVWHEVPYEVLRSAFDAYNATNNAPVFLAGSTNVTLAGGTTVNLSNQSLHDAYQALQTGRTIAANEDGDWVMSAPARTNVMGNVANQGSQAANWFAQQLIELLANVLQGNTSDEATVELRSDTALPLLDRLHASYIMVASANDTNLSMRVATTPDGDLAMSAATAKALLAFAQHARATGVGPIQQQLALFNDAAAIYDEADFVARMARTESLPAQARNEETQVNKLLLGVSLPDAIWSRFNLTVPPAEPLADADQNTWNGLWETGTVRAFTDAQGDTQYVMTAETWGSLLDDLAHSQASGGTAAVVHLAPHQLADANLALMMGVRVLNVEDLPGVNPNDLLTFATASRLLQDLPAGTALKSSGGALWMSAATANAAKSELRARLVDISTSFDAATDGADDLDSQIDALNSARQALHMALTPETFQGTDWAGHFIGGDEIQHLNALGVPIAQLSGTDPTLLNAASDLSYVVDAEGNAWFSSQGYARVTSLVSTIEHWLNAQLFDRPWQAVPGQGLWVLDASEAEFTQLLQAAHLPQPVVPGAFVTNNGVLDVAANTYATDDSGRIYVSDATHASLAASARQQALVDRAQFQQDVQAGLMDSTIDRPATLVFVADGTGLFERITASVATDVAGPGSSFDIDDLSMAERRQLSNPGEYHYATTAGGLLIGIAQLNALSNLVTGGAGPVEASEYKATASVAVVSNQQPMLAQWLEQLGHRFGHLVDEVGNPIAANLLDAASMGDMQRAQLQAQPGLIVRGTDGQLLMSKDTWDQLMRNGMNESTAAQAALAKQVQQSLDDAIEGTVAGQPGQALATLDTGAATLLAALDSLGMAYRLVDVVGNATDPLAFQPQALFAKRNGNALPLGIDADGRLVMSADTRETLSDWVSEFGRLYDLSALHLQSLGQTPTAADLEGVQTSYGDTQQSIANDWQGATEGIRAAYRILTTTRALMTSEMAADGVIKNQISKFVDYMFGQTDQLGVLRQIIDSELSRAQKTGNDISGELMHLNQANRNLDPNAPIDPVEVLTADSDSSSDDAAQNVKLSRILTSADLSDYGQKLSLVDLQLYSRRILDPHRATAAELAAEGRRLLKVATDVGDLLRYYADYNLASYDQTLVSEAQEGSSVANAIGALRISLSQRTNEVRTLERTITTAIADANGKPVLSADDVVALQTATDGAIDAARRIVDGTLEKSLSDALLPLKGMDNLDQHVKSIEGSEQYLASKKVNSASDAIQYMRYITSAVSLATHVPAAMADAMMYARLMNGVYAGTPEGEALKDKYDGLMKTSASSAVSTFFSNLQFFPWRASKSVADIEKYRKAWVLDGIYHGDGFILRPQQGQIPMGKTHKEFATYIAGQSTLAGSSLTKSPNLPGNALFQLADWTSAANSGLNAWYWTTQPGWYANYMATRHAVAAAAHGLVGSGDGSGSGVLAYLWRHMPYTSLADTDYGRWIYATGSYGGRFIAGGQTINNFILPTADLIAAAVAYGKGGQDVSWATVADTSWAVALTGLSVVLLNSGLPGLAMLAPVLFKTDFSAIQNIVENIKPMHDRAWEQERTVEYDILGRQYGMNVFRSIGVLQLLGGLIGFIEAAIDLAGSTTVEQFKTAVEQRVAALENHPDPEMLPLSEHILSIAQKLGALDRLHVIMSHVDDFTFAGNQNVQVMKSVVVSDVIDGVVDTTPDVHFFATEAEITGVQSGNNLNGRHRIDVILPNTSGSLATFVIKPDVPLTLTNINYTVQGPLMRIDASGSTVDSTNRFYVYNDKVAIHGGQGADLYLLNSALRPQISADGMDLIAGYIRDGIVSVGQDTVSWALAPATDGASAGHSIHMGTGAEGFSAYQGIQYFTGSGFNDTITRYGGSAGSRVLVNVSGGNGRDVFDLRSGDNRVSIEAGRVHFNLDGLTSADGINTDVLAGQGRFADAQQYEPLFKNNLGGKNISNVHVYGVDAGVAHVFGHDEAFEGVSFDFANWGLGVTYKSNADTIDNVYYTNRYEISARDPFAQSGSPTSGVRAVADDHIDALVGTAHTDHITIGNGAALKQISGNGGNDVIDVDVAGIGVYMQAGDSLIKLREHTSGARVLLGEGNSLDIGTTVQTGATANAVNVTAAGGSVLDTVVDARGSNELVNLHVLSGRASFLQGKGNSEVLVNEWVDRIDVTLKALDFLEEPGTQTLELVLNDLDDFSLDDLVTAKGLTGKFQHDEKDGVHTYATTWINSGGMTTVLSFQDMDDSIGAVSIVVQGTSYQLDQLIAS